MSKKFEGVAFPILVKAAEDRIDDPVNALDVGEDHHGSSTAANPAKRDNARWRWWCGAFATSAVERSRSVAPRRAAGGAATKAGTRSDGHKCESAMGTYEGYLLILKDIPASF